jgi:hypothetical protein
LASTFTSAHTRALLGEVTWRLARYPACPPRTPSPAWAALWADPVRELPIADAHLARSRPRRGVSSRSPAGSAHDRLASAVGAGRHHGDDILARKRDLKLGGTAVGGRLEHDVSAVQRRWQRVRRHPPWGRIAQARATASAPRPVRTTAGDPLAGAGQNLPPPRCWRQRRRFRPGPTHIRIARSVRPSAERWDARRCTAALAGAGRRGRGPEAGRRFRPGEWPRASRSPGSGPPG